MNFHKQKKKKQMIQDSASGSESSCAIMSFCMFITAALSQSEHPDVKALLKPVCTRSPLPVIVMELVHCKFVPRDVSPQCKPAGVILCKRAVSTRCLTRPPTHTFERHTPATVYTKME